VCIRLARQGILRKDPLAISMAPQRLNQILDNRYQLLELLGEGAMGQVYLARHLLLGETFAIKFLIQTHFNRSSYDRFFTEARTSAHLGQQSPYIIRVTDFGLDDQDTPYYVMENLQGESLKDALQQGPMMLPRFLHIVRQICLGLQRAHEGIDRQGSRQSVVHRDIKPSNIFLVPEKSGSEHVCLLDFGIAALLDADTTRPQGFLGTPAFAAPEQIVGATPNPRWDLYSLGVVMYQMLTGNLPVIAERNTLEAWIRVHEEVAPRPLSELASHLKVPATLESLIHACLSKQPEYRPASATEVLSVLDPLEVRFAPGRQIAQRIQTTLARLTTTTPQSAPAPVLTPEEVCALQSWPVDKPQARIVFPHLVPTNMEMLPTVWVMLPGAEIDQLRLNQLYNRIYRNFLCALEPQPTLLWVTAVFTPQIGVRWLPCFLELASLEGRETIQQLVKRCQYYVLLFSLERPDQCSHVMTVQLEPPQINQLAQWADQSRNAVSLGESSEIRSCLRQELEKLKPQVQQLLAAQQLSPSERSLNGEGTQIPH
jgi:serine/threonine protein kinase